MDEPGTVDVVYGIEPDLSADEFVDLLHRSTLAGRRPVDEAETIERMLRNADVTITARLDGRLVGVARGITDFSYCSYLSDLAVDAAYQRRGIGRALLGRFHDEAGLHTTLILLAAPLAREYYPRIGMLAHDSCWVLPRVPR
jgi:GNAT superfamily N-acetyltransferase